jgi:hypothetical protein
MGRLSEDERFEVVHAVIRDVRVDNQGGVEITSYLPEGKNRSGGPSGCGSDQFVVTSPNHTAVFVTPVVVCGLRVGGEIIHILPFLTLRTLRHVLTSAEQRC